MSPLRESRDHRLLVTSGVITMFGTMISIVAVPYEVKALTANAWQSLWAG